MAKLQQIQRLLMIVHKLKSKKNYISSEKLLCYINEKLMAEGTETITIRTLQRDFKEIDGILGIEIRHKHSHGYYIHNEENATIERYEEILNDLEVLSILGRENNIRNFVLEEHRVADGKSNLPRLIQAIKQSNIVEFDYTLVRCNNQVVYKRVEPYFLKESQNRWYLIGKEIDGEREEREIKVYGIANVRNLQVKDDEVYLRDESIDPVALIADSFGVWVDPNIPVQDMILSYSELDGKFIKQMPIHHSQEILVDTAEEFRIKLRLRRTNDFVMELLARSKSLKVIEPKELREEIYNIYVSALERNKN